MSYLRLCLISLIAVLFITSSVIPVAAQQSPIRNFHKVNDNLYRSGRLTLADLEYLVDVYDIHTIINMEESWRPEARAEAKAASELGIRFYSVPLPNSGILWWRPGADNVKFIQSVLNDEKAWPVLIHCKKGADRTGAMIAIYRIQHDGWAADKAINEMRQYGNAWYNWAMRRTVRRYVSLK